METFILVSFFFVFGLGVAVAALWFIDVILGWLDD